MVIVTLPGDGVGVPPTDAGEGLSPAGDTLTDEGPFCGS